MDGDDVHRLQNFSRRLFATAASSQFHTVKCLRHVSGGHCDGSARAQSRYMTNLLRNSTILSDTLLISHLKADIITRHRGLYGRFKHEKISRILRVLQSFVEAAACITQLTSDICYR